MNAEERLAEMRARDELERYLRSQRRRQTTRRRTRMAARYALWLTPFGLVNEGGETGWFRDDD